jgi:hypothetical protein
MDMDANVSALVTERLGYLRSGKTDRVALVDKELAALGFECDENNEPKPVKQPRKERAVAKKAPERAVDKD